MSRKWISLLLNSKKKILSGSRNLRFTCMSDVIIIAILCGGLQAQASRLDVIGNSSF
jgi:hypothetical protein